MTKEEEQRFIKWVENISVLYADYCSAKILDFVADCERAGLRHERKKAVSVLAKKRKLLEATIYKCLVEDEYFAEITQRLEDYTKREYDMLEYAMFNAIGKTDIEFHSLTAKALSVYTILLNVDASYTKMEMRMRQFRHTKPRRIAVDIKPLIKQIELILHILTKKNKHFVNLDEDEVVQNCIKVLNLRLADNELLNRIFDESEQELSK